MPPRRQYPLRSPPSGSMQDSPHSSDSQRPQPSHASLQQAPRRFDQNDKSRGKRAVPHYDGPAEDAAATVVDRIWKVLGIVPDSINASLLIQNFLWNHVP